ncbi:MAG: FGGY family carbohydrate kinase, partial [Angelakisella sp.]
VLTELMVSQGVQPEEIDSIGITNQRETTIVWNRETGVPVGNAIVWQCRRTAPLVDELCRDPKVVARIREKTGLVPDAYFSASKVKWILDNTPGARCLAEAGDLAFGTVDSWIIWGLTQGKVHATDVTNASRTMLYNIHTGTWDKWLCDLFDVPMALLPEVRPSSAEYGVTRYSGI